MKQILLGVLVTLLVVFSPLMQVQATELGTEPLADETGLGTASGSENLGTGRVDGESGTRMRYLENVGASIHIMDDGTATVTADAISGSSELTNLLVVAELQQLRNGEWTTLRTYRYFSGDSIVIISETCTVERGYYYRVVNTTTAYAGSDSETEVLETGAWNFYVPGT